ncbi:heme-binding protein [Lysobacter capsici]|nr:heme-binding protein [Lysobacter capsici]UOF12823.1 heme-binding protein [Lysobacter capsici]
MDKSAAVGGDLIGAFGVSGMQSVQDAQIAQARADELLEHDA